MSLASTAYRQEAVVIGAGVLGLACARALAETGRDVLIAEKEGLIGSGTSSRNSEVIHAGIYYPRHSLKADLCVRGKELLYQYCSERGIGHGRCGKLIVATNPSQLKVDLPTIVQRAEANGVNDLKLLTPADVRCIEPEVACHGALLSPSTGIVDSHSFMVSLLGDAEAGGATLALQSLVESAKVMRGKEEGILLRVEGMDILCDVVVNCAGLFAGQIASMILDADNEKHHLSSSSTNADKDETGPMPKPDVDICLPRQYFTKGNYYKLEGQRNPFSRLVYPVPEEGGLGVHATIDLGGQTRFGPDVEWIDPSIIDSDEIDLTVDPVRAKSFYSEVRKYWPGLKDDVLIPDYAGIRPKLSHPDITKGTWGKGDFFIQGPKDHGVPGFLNLLGMESPGLTSSMAIAELVVHILDEKS